MKSSKRFLTFFQSDTIIIFIIYFISQILFLLNFNAIYWDDWTLFNQDSASIMSQFDMNKALIAGYIHIYLFSYENTILIYRILTFFAFFVSALFLMKILKNLSFLDNTSIFYIILIYLLSPVNSAKIALINTPYILFLLIFFLAFYLLTRYLKKEGSLYYRLIILGLFFFSFLVNSLLVFYAIVLLYLAYTLYDKYTSQTFIQQLFTLFKKFLKKYLDFFLLPIVFFLYKTIYLVPEGLYANYNKITISLKSLLKMIYLLVKSFYTSLIEPIWVSLLTSLWFFPLFLLAFFLMYRLLSRYCIPQYKTRDNIILVGLGFGIFFLAVFPYTAVGKLPQLIGMESRHQLLVPLGFALIVYFSTIYIFNNRQDIITRMLHLLIAIFVIQNLYYGYRNHLDWFYQVGIEENIKDSKILREHTTFIVNNDLNNYSLLSNKRHMGFYEQNGRMKKVFGDDSRLMVENEKEIEKFKKYKNYKQYNFSSWRYEKPIYLVINATQDISLAMIGNLFYYQFFDRERFKFLTKKLITIDVREKS